MPSSWSWNACRAVGCRHLLDGDEPDCLGTILECSLAAYCMREASEQETQRIESALRRWKRRAEAV